MILIRKIAALSLLLALAVTAAVTTTASASSRPVRPVYLTGHSHWCTDTNPEFFGADDGMHVRVVPGTTRFTASYARWNGHWEDAYLITGWHDEPSSLCNGRTVKGTGGAKGAVLAPVRLRGPPVTASLYVTGTGTRLGFDLWLTAVRGEHTPTAMEHDRRTWEVLIEPGRKGHVYREGFVGWHRAFVGGGGRNRNVFDVRNLSLTALVRHLGIPGRYYWNAIGAGGEGPRGARFTVHSYHQQVRGDHPRLRHRKPKHHKKPEHKHRKPAPPRYFYPWPIILPKDHFPWPVV